jgi:spermidine/putrescine transport system substrate-binding protein
MDRGAATADGERPSASRRAVLGALGGAAVALAGCAGGTTGGASGGTDELTVSVYGGAYGDVFEETVANAYEAETGTTVNVAKAWSNRVSTLRSASQGSGDPPYDVIGLSGFNYLAARNEDLVVPVRYENVPNAEKVWPFFREYRTDEYGVPGEGGVLGIVYEEGQPHAETWADFATVDAPAGMNGGYWKNPLLIAALLTDVAPGVEEIYDPDTHDEMFATLETLAQNVATWYRGGADVWSALDGGQIEYGAFYYASGLAGIDARPDKNYGMVLPEQSPGYYTNFCVTDTDRRDEAERFLDFMLRTEIQTDWHQNGYYVPANREVAGSYSDRVQGRYPETNDALADFFVLGNSERLQQYQSALSDEFTRITSS